MIILDKSEEKLRATQQHN